MSGIGTQTDADRLATTHTATYANLSTAVNTVGGTAQPRLWTPVIVNTDRTPSGGSQRTWENYADEYMRYAFLQACYGQDKKNKVSLVLLNRDAWEQFLNLIDDKEEIQVGRGTDKELVSLGFEDHVKFDGVSVMWDDAVPTTDDDALTVHGYGFTPERMMLKVLGKKGNKQLFTSRVTFNDSYRSDNIFMHLLGNLKFESPRHFIKFGDISAAP